MKKVSRNIKTSRILICLLLLIVVACLLVFGGCTDKQKKEMFNKYGKEKAYTTYNGQIRHATSKVSYYLDPSVTGYYREAVLNAISEANKLTNAVSVSTTSNSNSAFVIKVKNAGKTGWVGVNVSNASSVITKSEITLNTYYLNNFSLNMIKEVAIHEIGHTFGLADLSAKDLVKYSVMYMSADSTYIFTKYQEFDKANIDWYYNK